MTQLHEDAQRRRSDLVRSLVLSSLAAQSPLEMSALAGAISRILHLPRSVNASLLEEELNRLHREGHIRRDGLALALTDPGRAEFDQRQRSSSQRLQMGQIELKNEIEKLTGHKLASMEWDTVWNILKDGLSTMFLAQGMVIVSEIASLLHDSLQQPQPDQLLEHIESIAVRIANMPGAGERAATIAQAVRDLFSERGSSAFNWLAELCSVYVDMCSLGLETRSQDQVKAILRKYVLILDTDIVLSLLSEAEANHAHVKSIIQEWRTLGCKLVVTNPVLEEAAHHAWIADADYEPNWRRLGDMSPEDGQRLLENVFVRAFHRVADGRYERSRWHSFIAAFRGKSDHDFEKIAGLLGDAGIQFVEESYSDPDAAKEFAKKLEDKLYTLRVKPTMSYSRSKEVREKCNRDARLTEFLLSYRQLLAQSDETAALVSTSKALRRAIEIVPDVSRDPEPVLHLSAIAWLLSLIPGARLTLGALRGVLFDAAIRKHLPDLERHLVRVVHASDQYALHWSRRNTLFRAVKEKLGKIAKQRGQPALDVERIALSGTDEGKSLLLETISDALDETARSRSEEEIRQLKARITDLERQLGKS